MAHFVPFLSLFFFLAVITHTTSSPQAAYWNSVLPDTPMPSAINDLMLSAEKYVTHVDVVGKGGVRVVSGKAKPGGTTVNAGGKGGVHTSAGKGNPGGGTTVSVGHGGINFNTGRKDKPPVIFRVNYAQPDPLFWRGNAATETQGHEDPRVTLFFSEHDLHPGAKMNLQFTKTTVGASFLSRQEADSIPFTSTELPEILRHLNIEPNSAEAKAMEMTLRECEEPAKEAGGEKYCATSLESMVDFSVQSLGTDDVKAISTSASKEDEEPQQYTVLPNGVQRMIEDKLVACHAEAYAYAVFNCHASSPKSKIYAVKMEGKDGAQVDAVAVCHHETKALINPKQIASGQLKVKPGLVLVCHFFPPDHVVWTRKN